MKHPRRGRKGDVHIFRPDGSVCWWVRYTVNGRQHRRNTGKEDEAEARIFAAEVARMVGMAQSNDLDEKRRLLDICRELIRAVPELEAEAVQVTAAKHLPTVRQWFDRQLDALQQNGSGDDRQVKDSTVSRVRRVFQDFLEFLENQKVNLANAPLDRVGPDDVSGFLADYKAKGFSGASRKFALARIRAVFGHAMDKGLLAVNPASVKQVGRLKFDSASIRQPFNTRQIAAVLNAAKDSKQPWLYLCGMLGLFTGQRAGDICGMKWEDVRDLDTSLPIIRIVQQKTGNTLAVPLAEPLRQVLKLVPKATRKGYLLPEEIAAAYVADRRRNFIRHWRDLFNKLDLASMTDIPTLSKAEPTGDHGRTRFAWSFHSFRHTCASHLSGPDSHYLLGHRTAAEKQLGQTAQYRHPDLLRLKKQLEAIPLAEPANVIEAAVNS